MSLNKLAQDRVIAPLIDSTEKHISEEGCGNLKKLLEKNQLNILECLLLVSRLETYSANRTAANGRYC